MKTLTRWCSIALALGLATGQIERMALATGSGDAIAAGMDNVAILIRSPDGKPVASLPIKYREVQAYGRAPFPDWSGAATDELGWFRLPHAAGGYQFGIEVPGVGYGATGIFSVLEGQTVTVPLPPLAPWARIESKVPQEFGGEGIQVKLLSGNESREVDAEGRLSAEVPAGECVCVVQRGTERIARSTPLHMLPGKVARDVRFVEMTRPPLAARPETIRWVQGKVCDAAGQPVAGAGVHVFWTYHAGIRNAWGETKAVTGPQGEYVIQGKGDVPDFTAALVAHMPDRPPALAWFRLLDPPYVETPPDAPRPEEPAPSAANIDLVLPDRGGTLQVQVMKDGQPAVDVAVRLSLAGAALTDLGDFGKLSELIHPVQRTDAGGIARFNALLPGLYKVVAAEGEDSNAGLVTADPSFLRQPIAYAIAEGIPVRLGETTHHRLAIRPQPNRVAFSIAPHDGTPFADEHLSLTVSPIDQTTESGSALRITPDGQGSVQFRSTGLFHASFKYGDAALERFPLRLLPHYAADAVVGVSPLLEGTPPVALQADRRDFGSIRVRLLTRDGLLRHGVVALYQAGALTRTASLIEGGGVTFDGCRAWNFDVRGYAANHTWLSLDEWSGPLPEDAALRGQVLYLPQRVKAEAGRQVVVMLREEAVGYNRGKLQPPPGRTAADYRVQLSSREYARGGQVAYHAQSGAFVAGPFAPGTVALNVRLSKDLMALCQAISVTVAGGEVTPATIEVPDSAHVFDGRKHGMTDHAPAGQVVLSDGKTPALGARLATFVPGSSSPVASGYVDARGRPQLWPRWHPAENADGEPADSPREMVAVAWLPGTRGTAIVPAAAGSWGWPQMTLPPPLALRGRAIVAGEENRNGMGRVQVRAQHIGRGKLDDLLSVEATAQEGGAFELAGLTPGEYRVQAALDGIWLSATVTLKVDTAGEPLTLTIPPPGGPVIVHVREGTGLREVFVQRPPGPFTERLWPQRFITDMAGTVRIPGLEAGPHTIKSKIRTAAVTVPTLTVSKGAPVEVSLRYPK